jgi:hypothetical protein
MASKAAMVPDRRVTNKEEAMKKLLAICFAGSLLMLGAAWAQYAAQTDTMKKNDTMSDTKSKATKVAGKISDDGKTFVSDSDSKTWAIENPDAVKGHEGHHVVLTAQVDADKSEVHVKSLKMAKAAEAAK